MLFLYVDFTHWDSYTELDFNWISDLVDISKLTKCICVL